ncbi:hypothetical protein O9929_07125 [Vibrio lentus]|nr:hypothetical protein [Vibrio lentus]
MIHNAVSSKKNWKLTSLLNYPTLVVSVLMLLTNRGCSAVFHCIPVEIPTLEQLGAPEML